MATVKPKQSKPKKLPIKPIESKPLKLTEYVCAKCDRRYLQTYPECPVCGGTLNQV